MKIAVIDADFIGRYRHRFPNLTCMKLSGWHKSCGDEVTLKTNYDGLENFDKVYIAKVFTDTMIPDDGLFGNPLDLPNVEYGGTGFFYDNAKPLPYEIEHCKPDYHLYDCIASINNAADLKFYSDYSIGFTTRGCFRHCPFCVNRRSNKVVKHSPLAEFVEPSRKKICLLDDNFFGCDDWKNILLELIQFDKPFQFRQGLDARLLDDDKARLLFSAKYDGDFTFAFDDWKDAHIIEEKLKLIRRHYKVRRKVKFYTLCAYDRTGNYSEEFWQNDLIETCKRLEMLNRYECLGYVMRFNRYLESPHRKIYNDLAAYVNQPQFFYKMPFAEFHAKRQKSPDSFVNQLQEILGR